MKIEFEPEFCQILHESILDGLENALGGSGLKVVLLNVDLARYMNNPAELHRNLRGIFNEGALVLEKVIVKELFRRLDLPYEEKDDFDFARHVNHAKELFAARGKQLTGEQNCEKKFQIDQTRQPHLKVIKTLWQDHTIQISLVVVDLNNGHEYPHNFLCIFPKNLFKKNRRGSLKRSRFFHVFGEKSHEVARKLLEDALKRERDLEARRQIESSLREVKEALHQRM